MSAEHVFSLCSSIAMAGWALLIFAPGRRWAALLASRVIPLVLAGAYLLALAPNWAGAEGGFGSLAEVAALFGDPWLLLAGWIHYLAFDLFIGAWQAGDATARNMSHWLVVPCLLLTFLFGPVGLLACFGLRSRPATVRVEPKST